MVMPVNMHAFVPGPTVLTAANLAGGAKISTLTLPNSSNDSFVLFVCAAPSSDIYRTRTLNTRLARANPRLALRVQLMRESARRLPTLEGYAGHIKIFLNLCFELHYNPFPGPWSGEFMTFYLQRQLDRMNNSCQSYRTWEAAVKYLGRCLNGDDGSSWYHSSDYQEFRSAMLKKHYRPPIGKLPFYPRHISAFTLSRGVRRGDYDTCSFDSLVVCAWLQLSFISFSRPGELLNPAKDPEKHGLRWRDVQFCRTASDVRYCSVSIRHYKNQPNREVPKVIWLASSFCRVKNCPSLCRVIDPYTLLYWMHRRRRRMLRNPNLPAAARRGLSLAPDAKVFVLSDGSELFTDSTSVYIKNVARQNALTEITRYTEYSLRVGGTTQASAAMIPDGFQYTWVGWSKTKLPDSGRGYCRPSLEDLMWMPFYMLHGFTATKGQCVIPTQGPAFFRDLWAECTR